MYTNIHSDVELRYLQCGKLEIIEIVSLLMSEGSETLTTVYTYTG